jgi:hypothetical protein
MRDLAVLHMVNRAEIDEVVNLGPESQTVLYTLSNTLPGQTIFPVASRTDDLSYVVSKGDGHGSSMTLSLAGGPGAPSAGYFKFLEPVDGIDRIQISSAIIDFLEIRYSTTDQFASTKFEIKGAGLRFVTDVLVGTEKVSRSIPGTDRRMQFIIPKTLAPFATIDKVRAYMSVDSAPLTSEVLFDIGTRASQASGVRLVMQRFMVLLLSPDGGDLYGILPKTISLTPQGRSVIANRLSLSVGLTLNRMRRNVPSQANPDEVLISASVEKIDIDESSGTVEAKVRLVVQSGDSISAPVILGG